MFLFLFFVAKACDVVTNQLRIYPTENKSYVLPLETLFTGSNVTYKCENCPDSLKIQNRMNPLYIGEYQNYTSMSLNSNRTHFVTITNEQQFFLYEFSNNIMQKQNSIQLNNSLKCFDAFFIYSEIWLDCYDANSNLGFYYLNGTQLQEIYQIPSKLTPFNTKTQTLFTQNMTYLLYGQYFNSFQILTLFHYDQFRFTNISTWQKPFNDFISTSKGFIYILNTLSGIAQVIVQGNKLEMNTFTLNPPTMQYTNIGVGQSLQQNSQSETILAGTAQNIMYILNGLNGSFIQFGEFVLSELYRGCFNQYSFVTLQITQSLFLYQCNNSFTIIQELSFTQTITSNKFHYFNSQNNQTQIYSYLDVYNNNIYMFSNNIEVYSIKLPQLLGVFNQSQKKDQFRILGTQHFTPLSSRYCEILISYQIIPENDTNIYVLFNSTRKLATSYTNQGFIEYLLKFSGPFIKLNAVLEDPTLGQFTDITLQQINTNIQQNFTKVKPFFVRQLSQYFIFLVGAQLGDIYFYICQLNMMTCQQVFKDSLQYTITSIQITQCYQQLFFVGVDQGLYQIVIYQYNIITQKVATKYLTFSQNYQQFLLTYEYLILLQTNLDITLHPYSANFPVNQIIINGNYIQDLFKNFKITQFQFNPKEIELNQSQQSGILFINNGNSLFTVFIQNQQIIPLHYLEFEFEIIKISLLYSQFIVTYQCQDSLCFQVWDNNDVFAPQIFQTLPSLNIDGASTIISDNIFLYVIDHGTNTVNVINPNLNYQNSFYYQFTFQGNYLGCMFSPYSYQSVIALNNQFFFLQVKPTQQFTPSIMNSTTNYITQTNYHFNISNPYNFTGQSENNILNIIDPLINIFFRQETQVINYNKFGQIIYNISTNINSSGQILYYQSDDNQVCNINNYINYQWQTQTQATLLTMLDGQLIQQNNFSFIYGVQGYNYSYQTPFNYCILSATYKQMLLSFCQNFTTRYLTSFISEDWSNQSSIIQRIYKFQTQDVFYGQTKLIVVDYNNALILGIESTNAIPQFYLVNINETSLNMSTPTYCDPGMQDFTIQKDPNSNLYLLIYVCIDYNQVLYQTGQMVNGQLQFVGLALDLINFSTAQFLLGYSILQIEILELKFNELILLITTNNITNFIITSAVTKYNSSFFKLTLLEIFQTIPPYGNYTQAYFSMVSNGLLLNVFNQLNETVYAIYNYATVRKSFQNPLVMLGGLVQNLPLPISVTWNVVSYWQGGQLYFISNQTLFQYSILNSTPYLTCNLFNKTENNFTLVAVNSFSNSSFILQFQYDKGQNKWLAGLIIFLVSVFGISIIVYWWKTRNFTILNDPEDEYQELEFEL